MPGENTRQTPEAKIAMKLAPQAKTVKTMISPSTYGSSGGSGQTESMLQTAEAIKNFANVGVPTLNEVAMKKAQDTVEQEYLQNKNDWKQFSDAHPILAHLNPHIQNTYARVEADKQIASITGNLIGKVSQRPDMKPEDYQQLLTATKQEAYQAASKEGVSYYDMDHSILPKLKEVEQQVNNQYYSANAKYQYETIKNGQISELSSTWDTQVGKPLSDKVKAVQDVFDKYGTDLSSLDRIDNIKSFIQNKLLEESENMSFNPKDFEEIIKAVKVDGKNITEVSPSLLADVKNMSEGYLSRRFSVFQQQAQYEDFTKEREAKKITDNLVNAYLTADPKDAPKILNQFMPQIKAAGLGSESLAVFSALKQITSDRMSLKPGALEDDLPTYNTLMKRAANGSLTDSMVLQSVTGGKLTDTTAKSLLGGLHQEQSNTVMNKAITSNATLTSLKGDINAYAGANGVYIPKEDVSSSNIIDGYANQFKAEYPMLAQQCQATKSLEPLIKRRRELAQQAINEIRHKPNAKLKTPGSFINPMLNSNNWISPVKGGRLSSTAADHIKREGAGNAAIDIVAKRGSPVVAPHDGIFKGFYKDPRSGYYAVIDIGQGHYVTLAHLDPSSANAFKGLVNKPVLKGSPIGKVGVSGYTQGVAPGHGVVHVVVKRKNGQRLDPQRFISMN